VAAYQTGLYAMVVAWVVLLARFFQASAEQRRPMRLLVYPLTLGALAQLVGNVLQGAGLGKESVPERVVQATILPVMVMIAAAVVIGVLRHHLFDIDLVARRSVVYGGLLLAIAAGYAALTAAPGLALADGIPVELAVLLTVAAAVAFQPLRHRLEALADRWVFGAKVNRYQLLTTFGAGLEQTVELAELLPRLADAVRRGLGAAWVRVSVPGEAAVAGVPAGDAELAVPLERDGQVIGGIECGPTLDGYGPADRELLATLAIQASTAIANLQLTAQLATRLDELTASRARIVAAADTERRRIERDLHDGVQQHVVALLTRLRLARNELNRGARPPATILDDVAVDARELLTDLRELAHGIHPPVLTDRGVVAAVEARADRLPLPVTVHAEPELRERRFPPDVETTAYVVVCEALTNVVKHAAARTADVELSATDQELVVHVSDDGTSTAQATAGGQGLTNLRDRVEALGGSVHLERRPGTGTCLRAELPIGARVG
jgi:signal transduction histidine kinase